MAWFKITFTPDDYANGENSRIRLRAIDSGIYQDSYGQVSMWSKKSPDYNKTRNKTWFIHSMNKEFLDTLTTEFNVMRCECPDKEGLSQEVGSKSDWDIFD
ncbi:MAG: hypothetical protein IH946_07825 [Bacteroidetes bacterium]|nr:hypothetical protein [Bacteroidota bacterium]